MNYFLFLGRKMIRNVLSLVPVVITIGVICLTYKQYYNYVWYADVPEKPYTPSVNAVRLRSDLTQLDTEDEYYEMVEEQIDIEQKRADSKEETTDWQAYCLDKIVQDKLALRSEPMGNESVEERFVRITNEIAYYRYFIDHPDVPYISMNEHRTGTTFSLYMLEDMLPLLLVITVIYELAAVLCSFHKEGIDTYRLFHMNSFHKIWTELLFGICVGIIYLLVSVLVCYGIASAFRGSGTFMDPVTVMGNDGLNTYVPFQTIIMPFVYLSVAGIVFTVSAVILLSEILGSELNVLMYGSGILIGGLLACENFEALKVIASVLPFTYLKAISVINGSEAVVMRNIFVNTTMGIEILSISACICLILAYGIEICKRKGVLPLS